MEATYCGKVLSLDCIWPSPISRGSSKAPWRSIFHYMDLVVDGVSCRLGDGVSHLFGMILGSVVVF